MSPPKGRKLNKRVQSAVLRRKTSWKSARFRVGNEPLSGSLQPGIRFLQPPIPAQPTAFLAVRLPEPYSAPAAIRAYHVPCALQDRVRACLSTGGRHGDVSRLSSETSGHIPFWLVPISSFGTAILTVFISSSHMLPIPVSLAPQPHCCSESLRLYLTIVTHPCGGYVVRRASHPTVNQ